jgi:hypothetical protein
LSELAFGKEAKADCYKIDRYDRLNSGLPENVFVKNIALSSGRAAEHNMHSLGLLCKVA